MRRKHRVKEGKTTCFTVKNDVCKIFSAPLYFQSTPSLPHRNAYFYQIATKKGVNSVYKKFIYTLSISLINKRLYKKV